MGGKLILSEKYDHIVLQLVDVTLEKWLTLAARVLINKLACSQICLCCMRRDALVPFLFFVFFSFGCFTVGAQLWGRFRADCTSSAGL